MSLIPFAPFWPDGVEDECGDEESEKDSNGTIADVIEIRYPARSEGSDFERIMNFRMP
jgi:hypothetical protein